MEPDAMNTKLPQIDSISNMKHNYNAFLKRLNDGPIVLTKGGQAVAVLVSPQQWDSAAVERTELMKLAKQSKNTSER